MKRILILVTVIVTLAVLLMTFGNTGSLRYNARTAESIWQVMADTTTARLALTQPAIGSTGWGTSMNNNLATIDNLAPNIVTHAGNYTLVQADMGTVQVCTAGGGCTFTITDSLTGVWFAKILDDASAGTLTINRQTSGTIDGGTTLSLVAGQSVDMYSNGSNAYRTMRNMTRFVASGTAAMGTSAITSGACATVVTVSATGVLTTDVISTEFNGDPTAITGYGASATGAVLTIYPYPTADNVNFKVCNSTASSITPGALTLNWRVAR